MNSVFPSLVAGRLVLALTNLPNVLRNDNQLSSPLTSYANLQEGIYLFNNGIDPYSGGVFRHSPLYLSLFSTILPNSPWSAAILSTIGDAVAAWALVQIFRTRQNVSQSSRDGLVAAMYLLNPYLFLPTLALSTSSYENMFLLLSLMFACKKKPAAALLTLAFLFQISIHSVLLLVPIILLIISDPASRLASPQPFNGDLRKSLPLFGQFVTYSAFLTVASTIAAGGFGWIEQTWGANLMLPDLTPNPGMWWYFFTEMFDHFRPFFLMVFSVHLVIYVAPICVKFQYDPLYAAFLLLGVLGIFKPYPTLSDPGLFVSMFSLFPEIYPYLQHPIVTVLLHLHASLLLPLFHNLWLNQGTGNANFFYASTLVFACANGATLLDAVWAGLSVAIGKAKEGYLIAQE